MVGAISNLDVARLKKLDRKHHMQPFTDYGAAAQSDGSRIITHAKGIYIYDSDGNEILDGMAGLWCVNAGYGRRELANVAFEQLCQLPYYNTFFRTSMPPTIELAAKIASLLDSTLCHIFFNNSGSEANDTIFRMVRHYWALKGEPDRNIFITRQNAYHGTTVAGASLGGMTPMHEQGGLPIPGIEHIEQPYYYRLGDGQTVEDFGRSSAQALERRILEVGPEKVACFMAEPIQGAGGVIIPPESYWPEVVSVCQKYDILIAADEVITGFGRVGKWFGHQHYGFTPDLVSMAKGLSSGYIPISAVAVSSKIMEVLAASGQKFAHGYTYSGHPVAAAVALKNIEIIEQEGLVEKTDQITGPLLHELLQPLKSHPLVGDVRSLGLLAAVEIVQSKETKATFEPAGRAGAVCHDTCLSNGLVVRAIGDILAICPPLTIEPDEIQLLIKRLKAGLDDALKILNNLHMAP